jgi:Mn2+/Fe2+ NRAMP family transporter
MLAVPVLAGSAAYAVAEARAWHGTLEARPRVALRLYAVIAVAMLVGLALDDVGFNAVKMLLYAAVLNGMLAPPLIVLVVLLTSNTDIMGTRVSSHLLHAGGWATAAIMTDAGIAMFMTM